MEKEPDLILYKEESFTYIKHYSSNKIYKLLKETLAYLPEDYMWRDSYTVYGKDGKVRLLKNNRFPTGLLDYVFDVCDEHNIIYEINSCDKKLTNINYQVNFNVTKDIVLRDYQIDVVNKCLEKKRGLVKSPTGSGKSLMAAEFIRKANSFPTLVCVMNKDLFSQTVDTYKNYLGCDIGVLAEGELDIKPISIGMVQTIVSGLKNKQKRNILLNYLSDVKNLVIDECHHQIAETLQKVAYSCNNTEYRIGFSGTPYRGKSDDMEIEAALGRIIYNITVSDMIQKGYLVKPKIFMFDLLLGRYKSHKPYPQYCDIIEDYIVKNSYRNSKIASLVENLVEKGKSVLVLVNRLQHGNLLEELIEGSKFMHGNRSLKDRNEALEDFKNKKYKVLIATSIIDEGWDCPSLDALVLAHPYKSLVKCYQRLGRALRPFKGKDSAIIVDFIDDAKYLKKQSARRIELYKNEPEFELLFKTY